MIEKFIRTMTKKRNRWYGKYQIILLRIQGAKIGKNVNFRGKIYIDGKPINLMIGDECTINESSLLNCRDRLKIGNGCHISAFAQIHTGALIMDQIPRRHYQAPIEIGNDVWIAANCIINPGVSIADGCVIGGNSIVTRSIETKNTFYAGTPAKLIKTIQYTKEIG